MAHQITNYDGGIVTSPQQLVYAETVEQIQAILKDTERFPSPVRAMGSFHSLTPCPSSSGTIVNMSRLNRILEINLEEMTLTAQTGLQLIDAARALRAAKLQFMTNIEIGNITLGSAACCHTKDALDGVEHGQVNSYVTRIKWVDPSGELQEASDELLYLARSSYGLCGVIYEVTFKLKPLEAIRFTYFPREVDHLTEEEVSRIISGSEGLICWTLGRTAIFQSRNRATAVNSLTQWMADVRRLNWSYTGAFVGRFIQSKPPALAYLLLNGWFAFFRGLYAVLHWIGGFALYDPDKIVDYRATPPSARYAFTFWAFPRSQWLNTLKAYLEFSETHFRNYGFRCNMPLGSYFIRQDESSILSYTHDGDIISIDPIHAYAAADKAAWDFFLTEFNCWASQRNGIPLLNQSPFVNRTQVHSAYGARWERFRAWVRTVDPNARMLNPFFSDLL